MVTGEKMTGLERSFLASWEEWDEVGAAGDLCFYGCKLKPLPYLVIPEGTDEISMTIQMSESTVQFDFYGSCGQEYLESKAFKIIALLEEEIRCDE